MNSKTITVTAHVRAKAGNENAVREILLSLIGPSRKDEGCLNYDLHQAKEDATKFLFHENWASKELLEAHLQTPHVQSAVAKVTNLLAEPPQIILWDKIA